MSLEERLERDVQANLVPYLLLEAVRYHNNESYGYEMKKFVEKFINKTIPEGTLYPLLNKLSNTGYLETWTDESSTRRKRFYSLTPKGEKEIVRWLMKWQELEISVNSVLRQVQNGKGI